MDALRSSFLVLALCAAGSAYAQTDPAVAGQQPSQPAQQPAQRGFFAPTPGDDPSLFRTLPPEAYANPASPGQATPSSAQPSPARAASPLVVVVPDPNVETREQMERARIEAQQAAAAQAARMPAPINGAFTGATDEADRR